MSKKSTFKDEGSESIEIGAKLNSYEGRGRLNVSVFAGDFEGVQVSAFDCAAGFLVGHTAKISTDGVEIDGMFAVTDELIIYSAAACLDANYNNNEGGPCTEAHANAV